MVGDRVLVVPDGEQKGTVADILPRKNYFLRPAVANLDLLVILASCSIPVTDPFLIDRMTAIAIRQGVRPVICVNKTDLCAPEPLADIYRLAGFPVVCTSAETGTGIDALRALICGRTAAFTGNSGVGKSAILSRLCPNREIETGAVSQKLGRGRHTTRHVELYPLGDETYVADTPGFSSLDLPDMTENELAGCFPEFAPFTGECAFRDCRHEKEKICGIRRAVQEGLISQSRYDSYLRFLSELRGRRPY